MNRLPCHVVTDPMRGDELVTRPGKKIQVTASQGVTIEYVQDGLPKSCLKDHWRIVCGHNPLIIRIAQYDAEVAKLSSAGEPSAETIKMAMEAVEK